MRFRKKIGVDDGDLLSAAELVERWGKLDLSFARGGAPRLEGARLVIPRGMAPDDENFQIARGLAAAILEDDAAPATTSKLAAALLMPAPTVRRAYRAHGEKYRPQARAFGVSQAAVVLRLGDVLGDDRAVITRRGRLLRAGAGRVAWEQLPLFPLALGRAPVRGLVRAELRGGTDDGRVALRTLVRKS